MLSCTDGICEHSLRSSSSSTHSASKGWSSVTLQIAFAITHTDMRACWRVQNLLHGAHGMLDVRELSHGDLGGNDWCKPQSRWFASSACSLSPVGCPVPSVTIPRLPSAPMTSFVISMPADDLRARRRVLMTLPFGRTTVFAQIPQCLELSVVIAYSQH